MAAKTAKRRTAKQRVGRWVSDYFDTWALIGKGGKVIAEVKGSHPPGYYSVYCGGKELGDYRGLKNAQRAGADAARRLPKKRGGSDGR